MRLEVTEHRGLPWPLAAGERQGGCLPVSSELTDTLILDSGLQNRGRVGPCCARCPVGGDLLRQPRDARMLCCPSSHPSTLGPEPRRHEDLAVQMSPFSVTSCYSVPNPGTKWMWAVQDPLRPKLSSRTAQTAREIPQTQRALHTRVHVPESRRFHQRELPRARSSPGAALRLCCSPDVLAGLPGSSVTPSPREKHLGRSFSPSDADTRAWET